MSEKTSSHQVIVMHGNTVIGAYKDEVEAALSLLVRANGLSADALKTMKRVRDEAKKLVAELKAKGV